MKLARDYPKALGLSRRSDREAAKLSRFGAQRVLVERAPRPATSRPGPEGRLDHFACRGS